MNTGLDARVWFIGGYNHDPPPRQPASLLQTQSDRLDEARQLAEEALAIKKTMDPSRLRRLLWN